MTDIVQAFKSLYMNLCSICTIVGQYILRWNGKSCSLMDSVDSIDIDRQQKGEN